MCNDSSLSYDGKTGSFKKIGESTEIALRVLAEKIGLPGFDDMPGALTTLSVEERATYCAMYWHGQFERVCTLEFDRDRKMMSVLTKRKGQRILFTKGSPEAVLLRCTQVLTNSKGIAEPITKQLRNALIEKYQTYARGSLRVLALAMRPMPPDRGQVSIEDEEGLTLLGFCGMADPPRPEVKRAVDVCRGAGIRIVMVTGDNKLTAEAIANRIGLDDITGSGSHPTTSIIARQMTAEAAAAGLPMTGILFPPNKSCTGPDFDGMDPQAQNAAALSVSVFSRVEPQHKTRLVELLKAQGQVVAMTGDGVNDAPALRRADIGIAMGSGTAVAKHAADMVLADDNFATIVIAVAEGRAIFNNTKQFVRYMVSSNIGKIASNPFF
jgi:magnesium-transporting ATPase (P-type)